MNKRIFVLVIAIVMAFTICGCSMVRVNEERDAKQVVAVVNGEEILKGTVSDLAVAFMAQNGVIKDSTYFDAYYEMKLDDYFEDEILFTLLLQKCEEFGIEPLTEKQQAEIETKLEDMYNLCENTAINYINNNFADDEFESEEAKQKAIDDYREQLLADRGYYGDEVETVYRREAIVETMKEYLSREYDPTDAEVKEYYDFHLAEQKEIIEKSYASFENLESTEMLLHVPEGLRYIRYIHVEMDEQTQEAIEEAEDAEDEELAESLKQEGMKAAKQKADEAHALAQTDFKAAIEQYSDVAATKNEDNLESGFRVYEKSASYESALVDAAFALGSVGDISGVVEGEDGYYIVEFLEEVEGGDVPFAQAKEALREQMKEEYYENHYLDMLNQWLDESLVRRYEDVLHNTL